MMKILNRILRDIYHTIKGDSLFIMKRRGLNVGERFFLGNARLDTNFLYLIKIGDDVTLAGSNVTILAHDASTKCLLNYTRIGKVTIGNRVFVGAGTTILPGVTIGDDVVIGAGSLVANNIPARSVAMGNPAKVKCTIEEFIDRRRREMQTYPLLSKQYVSEKSISAALENELPDSVVNKFVYIP